MGNIARVLMILLRSYWIRLMVKMSEELFKNILFFLGGFIVGGFCMFIGFVRTYGFRNLFEKKRED